MLNYYDFTAAISGAEFRISAAGTYLRYYSGAAAGLDSRIIVKCDSRSLAVVLKPGQAVRLDAADGKAVDWRLSNYAKQAAISGFVVIGDGQLDDSTITGDVNVIDNAFSRTIGNGAFVGAANNNAPVAAQNPNVELWNPAGSGKLVVVESLCFSSSTAQTIVVGDSSTALASAMAAGSVMSKYSAGVVGASVGVGEMRYTNQAGAPIVNSPMQFQVLANIPQVINFREPFVLPEGRGLLLYGVTVNSYLICNFEWFEQAR